MAFVLEQKHLPAFLAAPPMSDEQFVLVTAPSSSSVSRSISEIDF
jgi:hypothetical protein